MKRRLGAPAAGEASPMTLTEWFDRWVAAYGRAVEENTLDNRTVAIDAHLTPLLGGVRLRDLGRARLIDYRRDALDAGRTPASWTKACASCPPRCATR